MSSLGNTNNIQLLITNQIAGTGFKDAKNGLEGIAKSSDQTANRFNILSQSTQAGLRKVSLATGALAIGVTAYAKNATDYYVGLVKDTQKLSRETGLSVADTSKLLAVTKKMGLETTSTSLAFGVLSKQIVASRDATGQNALKIEDMKNKIAAAGIETKKLTDEIKKNGDKSGELHNKIEALNIQVKGYKDSLEATTGPLQKLNIATQNADGSNRSFKDILFSIADKFKGMPDGVEKTTLSMELFGKKGKDLIKTLNLGSDGIQTMEAAAQKLGITLSSQNVADVARLVAAQKRMKDQTDSLKLAVGALTTPVLASFEEHLNSVTQKLIAVNSPFRAVTANVLAFGGPVLTATSATTGFLGNLSSINAKALATSAKFGLIGAVAAASAAAFGYLSLKTFESAEKTDNAAAALGSWQARMLMTMPAVGALTAGIAALAGQHFASKYAADQLTEAHNRTKLSMDEVRNASNLLRDAEFGEKGAKLQVEEAQNAVNDAVKSYGPKSLEARQANYNLEQANRTLKAATDQTRDAINQQSDAEKAAARNKELENKLGAQRKSAGDTRSAILDVVKAVANYDGMPVVKKLFSIGIDVDKALLHKLHIPGFASGVQSFKGGLAVVGERGPELVNLPQGASVYSNRDSQRMVGGSAPSSQYNHYGDIYLGNAGAVSEYFNQVDRDHLNLTKGLSAVRGAH